MFCQKCGTKNSETASFCSKCGDSINGSSSSPPKKKRNKTLWIIGSIVALSLICCVAPAGYGYYKIKTFPTSTPYPTKIPTRIPTEIPTDIPMPKQVVVKSTSGDCAPVYHDTDGSASVDCIPNGALLDVFSPLPTFGETISHQRQYWAVKWIVSGEMRFKGKIRRRDVELIYEGDPTPIPLPTYTPLPTGKWTTEFEQSSFDDSQTVILRLRANSSVNGWPNKTETPVLIVRCKEGKTEIYIGVGMSLDVEYGLHNKSTVRVRFDLGQAEEIITSHSTEGEAVFFPDAQYLISRMLQSEKMVFGFTPFNAPPVETSFNLHGLNEAIKPLQEACR